jgi:hypothetical protein
MEEAYIVKKITYYIDREVVERNTESNTFDITKFDLMNALVESDSDMQVIGVCDSLKNAKNLIRNVTGTNEDEGDFETVGNITEYSGTNILYNPNPDEDDLEDDIGMIIEKYEAVKVPINTAFEVEEPGVVNYENFYDFSDCSSIGDAKVPIEMLDDEVVEFLNKLKSETDADKPDLTSLDFGAFFNNGNKNIPS